MKIFIIITIILIIYFLITYLMFIGISKTSMNKFFKVIDKNIDKILKPYKDICDKGYKWVSEQVIKDYYIKSVDNINLHAIFIEHPKEKGVMILAHGYRSTKERDLLPSLYQYYQLGYSLLVVDNRGAGKSEGKYITFGFWEKKDIESWINYIYRKRKTKIILAGVSQGASTILMVNNKHVDAIIADSGYTSAWDEVRYVIKHFFHIPSILFIYPINLYARLFAKYDLKITNTLINLPNLSKYNIPILFIHGLADDFVPSVNTCLNYNNYSGDKDILLVDGAQHGMGYLVDSDTYIKKIKEFLKKIQ